MKPVFKLDGKNWMAKSLKRENVNKHTARIQDTSDNLYELTVNKLGPHNKNYSLPVNKIMLSYDF